MPVQVEEGKEYYFEAYFRSDSQACSIKWRFDDESRVSSIPASSLRALLPVAGDANDDGLPDGWQTETGVSATGEPDSWGDPDGDGVTNFEELVAGTDPVAGAETDGFLLWESWYGTGGGDVADLVRSPAFHGPPDRVEYLHGAETPPMNSGPFGSRLSGYIVPAESGSYEIAIASDDSAELWLSDGPSSLRKDRIAFNDRWRKKGQWDAVPAQVSKPLSLQAGQAYFVEILHKDSGNPGWVAVGWRKAGTESFVTVPPACLRSPAQAGKLARDEVAARIAGNPRFQSSGVESLDVIATSEHADPDRDGIANLVELRQGTDPMQPDKVQGMLTREWWFDQAGQSLSRSRANGSLLRPSSMTSFFDTSSAGTKATTDWFVSRMRGSITPPTSGSYRFWISGDDHCELWLSTDDRKFRKMLVSEVSPNGWEGPDAAAWTPPLAWDASRRQESAPVELVAGRSYFIEVLHKDGNSEDHVAVAWQHRAAGATVWSDRGVVDPAAITSYVGDPDDLDDDYLPDPWESQYGLDLQDNGLTDRARQGEDGDFDVDRLTNREEFMLGTNPALADSDGDGVGDHDEVNLYESDPTAPDASPPVKLADLQLSRFLADRGLWTLTSRGTLLSMTRRGAADFKFNTQEPGIYLVELKAVAHATAGYAPPVPVLATVDGTNVGRGEVSTVPTTIRWFTPWLPAGDHVVTIDNRNVRLGVGFEILGISLYRHVGEDSNENRIPDWMERLFTKQNGIGLASTSSFVSPLCLEGKSRFPGTTRVIRSGSELAVTKGVGEGWYADVALDPEADTPVTLSYEGGSLRSDHVLTWTTTNLFETSDEITLRKGDSLKVMAVPTGSAGGNTTARITLDSSPVADGPADEAHVLTFDTVGSHVIQASAVAGTETLEAATRVKVVEADFGPLFNVATNAARVWQVPGVPHELVLETDSELSLLDLPRDAAQPRALVAQYAGGAAASPRVLARLGPGGPIVNATSVNVFHIAASSQTRDARLIDVLPDGTRVLEFMLMIDGVIPADLSIWLEFYVTDAVFADGSTRYHLTAADFDENGVARILVYKAPGTGVAEICHWIRPYDADEGAPPNDEGVQTPAEGEGE